MEPNKKNIQKWVDALRSGKYSQAHGKLTRDNCFCCLGVACEISGVEKKRDLYGITGERHFLPLEVYQWLGINSRDPLVFYGNDFTKLTAVNDEFRLSFDQIANLIEKHYLS